MELLAEGGYMVGKMAQLLYPEGIEIKTDKGTLAAIEQTQELLKRERVILFEPAIYSDHKLVRIDILIKDGNRFQLIEVKSKSLDGDEHIEARQTGGSLFIGRGNVIKSEWQPYLEDVTFQTLVLQEVFPQAEVTPFLLLPDKAKRTQLEGLLGWFHIAERTVTSKGFKSYEVVFNGDAALLREDSILSLIDVTRESAMLAPIVHKAALTYVTQLRSGLAQKTITPLTKDCRECEFNVVGAPQNGFLECWGELATPNPHIFDLYYMGTIGGNKAPYVNELIAQGKTSLYDMPDSRLTGKRGDRQKIQIAYTKKNEEWIDPALAEKMKECRYPLHFIDFETSRMALPYHKGMRPYEQVIFQWSCHTISEAGAAPTHAEWINVESTFPNFEFAQKLKEHLGNTGTVFMWATHENSALRDIYEQMEVYGCNDAALQAWLLSMIKFDKDDDEKMLNLCKWTEDFYFHPAMKGRTSLKVVLPAIWNNNAYLHEIPYLKKYVQKLDGKLLDPYKTLVSLPIAEQAEVIKDGTGAMRAYQEMMYGLSSNDQAIRQNWAKLLLQYCELDTMAMVIVWLHWSGLFKI